MSKRVVVVIVVVLSAWLGIRLVAAERVSEPAYILRAGNDFIQQEWNYNTRLDRIPNPATVIDRTLNYLNGKGFQFSRPLFWLENRLLGCRIEKGDPAHDKYMKRLDEIRVTNWDYVVSPKRDGSPLLVVKNGSIVQKVE
jgi:hypothetical protein